PAASRPHARQNAAAQAAGIDLQGLTDAGEREHVTVRVAQHPGERFSFERSRTPSSRSGVLEERADAVLEDGEQQAPLTARGLRPAVDRFEGYGQLGIVARPPHFTPP